jgi:hypothetical protein
MTRDEKIEWLKEINADIYFISGEIHRCMGLLETKKMFQDALLIDRANIIKEIRLDGLVYFCNTGKYPE